MKTLLSRLGVATTFSLMGEGEGTCAAPMAISCSPFRRRGEREPTGTSRVRTAARGTWTWLGGARVPGRAREQSHRPDRSPGFPCVVTRHRNKLRLVFSFRGVSCTWSKFAHLRTLYSVSSLFRILKIKSSANAGFCRMLVRRLLG